jgi:hypothetical protein
MKLKGARNRLGLAGETGLDQTPAIGCGGPEWRSISAAMNVRLHRAPGRCLKDDHA